MTEFDFQWDKLPSDLLDLTEDRVTEVLNMTRLPISWFPGKTVLDAGCGTGRYTWALQQLGAKVTSADISPEAVAKTRTLNPRLTYQMDLSFEALYWSGSCHQIGFDLVFSFGMIHHTRNPRGTFRNLATMVYPGGYLFVMVYNRKTQWKYYPFRWIFRRLSADSKLVFAKKLSSVRWFHGIPTPFCLPAKTKKNLHGWWDALNPRYNYGFTKKQIFRWFEEEGFDSWVQTPASNLWIKGKR